MKSLGWKDIRGYLRGRGGQIRPRPAGEFWSEFSARARSVPQEEPAALPHPLLWPRIVVYAAASLLLCATAWTWIAAHHAGLRGGNSVKRIEVFAPHDGVVILDNDEDVTGSAAVVWVVGLKDG